MTQIIRHAEDDIECLCGNRPHLDGFYVSDADGTIREGEMFPEPEWDGDTMTCWTCGRTFSLSTNEILGQTSDLMLAGARLTVA